MINHIFKKIRIIIGLLCFFSLAYSPIYASEKPITIGYVSALSGPAAMYGVAGRIAGEMAIEEINAAGGVLGRKLKQINRDSKAKPDSGVREAKSLVLGKNVDFLTGTISSAVGQAISAFCKQKKKMMIINVSKSARTTGELGHRYIFRFTTNSTTQTGTIARAAAEKWGSKKVFIIGPDYEFGHQCKRDFLRYYKQQIPNVNIVGEAWPKLGTTDYGVYISKIVTSGADLLFSSLYGGMELTFVKQAVPYGLYDKKHVASLGPGDPETWSNVKKGDPAPIGALSGSPYPYWAIDNPISKKFAKNFQEKSGLIPNYGALAQYTIIYALKESIEAVGAVDTEKIIDYWEGRIFETPIGPIKIRACDHQAMAPTWFGVIGWGDDLSFPHLVNLNKVKDIESTYRSCSEIKDVRKTKK